MTAGRPTTYSKEITTKLCGMLSDGQSLRTACKAEDMPALSTIFLWLRDHPEFSEQYALAKEECADALVEDMLDIADNQVSQPVLVDGVPLKINGEVVKAVDGPSVNHARLRVDTRKWAASKLKPKKYGERITQEHTGSVGLTDMTEDQLDAKLQALMNASSKESNSTAED